MAASVLRGYARTIAAYSPDWPATLQAVRKEAGREDWRIWEGLWRLQVPALASHVAKLGRTLALIRAARAALAIEGYRREQDRLPPSLADLTEDTDWTVPLDPFTSRPLIYSSSETGFRVYSVGDDLRDEGGGEQWPAEWHADPGLRVRLSGKTVKPE